MPSWFAFWRIGWQICFLQHNRTEAQAGIIGRKGTKLSWRGGRLDSKAFGRICFQATNEKTGFNNKTPVLYLRWWRYAGTNPSIYPITYLSSLISVTAFYKNYIIWSIWYGTYGIIMAWQTFIHHNNNRFDARIIRSKMTWRPWDGMKTILQDMASKLTRLINWYLQTSLDHWDYGI